MYYATRHCGLPICLRNSSAPIPFSTHHHDSLVLVLIHIRKRRMTLHKHARIHLYTQLPTQIPHALGLMFPTPIRQQDKRDALGLEV